VEYLFAVLILVGIWSLTTMLTGVFGIFIPIIYTFLGFLFGSESIIIGTGGFIGSVLTVFSTNMYIRTQGAMSRAPVQGRNASIGFIVAFVITIFLEYIMEYDTNATSYLIVFLAIFACLVVLNVVFGKRNKKSVESLLDSVVKYKIVAKYEDDPRWATYIYLNNGVESWNKTIPGSFLAKDPGNDLTFVHNTKDEALRYAQNNFKNAEFIEE